MVVYREDIGLRMEMASGGHLVGSRGDAESGILDGLQGANRSIGGVREPYGDSIREQRTYHGAVGDQLAALFIMSPAGARKSSHDT